MIYSVLPQAPEAFLALFPFFKSPSPQRVGRESRAQARPVPVINLSLHQGNAESGRTSEHGTGRGSGRLSRKPRVSQQTLCDFRGRSLLTAPPSCKSNAEKALGTRLDCCAACQVTCEVAFRFFTGVLRGDRIRIKRFSVIW